MSDTSNLSFDRMRGMLTRAAEIRDSEQQQIFDSLDEIHARLAALDAIGTVRKKLKLNLSSVKMDGQRVYRIARDLVGIGVNDALRLFGKLADA